VAGQGEGVAEGVATLSCDQDVCFLWTCGNCRRQASSTHLVGNLPKMADGHKKTLEPRSHMQELEVAAGTHRPDQGHM
jgi:hypothetical protein